MYEFKNGLRNLSGNHQAVLLCIILSMPIWLFELLSIFFSARAVHFDLSMGLTVIAGITAFVMQAIPTTPAGIGVHEGTIAGVLMLFGIDASIGTSIALVDHFARAAIIFTFGIISAIHIGFESRTYFAGIKNKNAKALENEPEIRSL